MDDWHDAMRVHHQKALIEARSARRRRVITPTLFARVLELYKKGGIKAVMDELNYSERNARRLLARAKKELGE